MNPMIEAFQRWLKEPQSMEAESAEGVPAPFVGTPDDVQQLAKRIGKHYWSNQKPQHVCCETRDRGGQFTAVCTCGQEFTRLCRYNAVTDFAQHVVETLAEQQNA